MSSRATIALHCPSTEFGYVKGRFQLPLKEFGTNIPGISPEATMARLAPLGLAKDTRLGFAHQHRLGRILRNLWWRYSV
jgi:hypothetical protein